MRCAVVVPLYVVMAVTVTGIVTAIARAIKDIKWADVFWAVLGKFGIKRNGNGNGGGAA